jgi:ComF family protein
MLNAVVNLFFPKVCYTCYYALLDFEKYVCTKCRHDLPITNFHFDHNNTVEKVFYGRVKVENATSLLRFEKKGVVQQLIHNLKYKGYEDIGIFLGEWLGNELKTIESYNDVDVIIPVPLHKKKLKKRGYNQVDKFAQEIAKALAVEYNNKSLIKITSTKSQVNKKRLARWQITNELFALEHAEQIENKHILLVDDIITTGATLEACINVLKTAKNVKISVATMAIV